MALIKCVECNKEVSDSAKVCPHCGYKLKKSIFDKKDGINNINFLRIISIFLFIFGLLTSLFGPCMMYSSSTWDYPISIVDIAYYDVFYYSDVLFYILGFVSVLMLIVPLFKIKRIKLLNKIKDNELLSIAPAIVLSVIVVIFTFLAIFDLLGHRMYESYVSYYYVLLWGGVWNLLMYISSSSILIYDYLYKKKNKKGR